MTTTPQGQIFPGGFDRHPAVIVRVAGTQDVAGVFDLARHHGFELSVRGGGHTPLCVADGAVMLDLRGADRAWTSTPSGARSGPARD